MPIIPTQYMGLSVPVAGLTPGFFAANAGQDYASLVSLDLATIDSHDHSSGRGRPIPMSALAPNPTATSFLRGDGVWSQDFSPGLVTATGSTTPHSEADRWANVHWAQDFATLAAAITAANASGKTLIIATPFTITTAAGTLTVPVRFEGLGVINSNAGGSVTFTGSITSPRSKIFNTSGGGTISLGQVNREVYPQWWGAVGDGSTDDSPAFAAAVAAINTVAGGKIIVPATSSHYNVHGLSFLCNGMIEFLGIGKPQIFNPTTGQIMDIGDDITGSNSTFHIDNINFVGNGGSGDGIFVHNVEDAVVERCRFANHGVHGLKFQNSFGQVVRTTNFQSNGAAGLDLEQQAGNGMQIQDCKFFSNNKGVWVIGGCSKVTLQNCELDGNSFPMVMDGVTVLNVVNTWFENSGVPSANPILTTSGGTNTVTIKGCYIQDYSTGLSNIQNLEVCDNQFNNSNMSLVSSINNYAFERNIATGTSVIPSEKNFLQTGDFVVTSTVSSVDSGLKCHFAAAHNTVNGSLPDSTPTIINFDTVDNDTAGTIVTGASWHYTIPHTGVYNIQSLVTIIGNTGGSLAAFAVTIYRNGSIYKGGEQVTLPAGLTSATIGMSTSISASLTAADNIDIRVNQITGNTWNVIGGPSKNWISIIRVPGS